MSQKILGFRISQEKHAALQGICARLGIELVDVAQRDYAQKLGALAGIKGFPKEKTIYNGPVLPAEMLVFSGMNSGQVDDFLAAYRETGLAPVALKAVVTPGNIRWNAQELFRELLREHEKLSKPPFV
jgi:hypothetical protein